MNEAIDERDDAGGVREHLAPLREGLVGAEQDWLLSVVAPRDDLEEQVGVAAVVGKVADLIDTQQLRRRARIDDESCAASAASMSLAVVNRTVCPRLSAC